MPTSRRVDLLERIGNLIRSDAREAAHGAGIQPVQLEMLAYLGRCNRYSDTPAAVADYLGLTKGTVSQSLQRLEERGLVERRPDEADGRVSHLGLTAEGRKVLRSRSRRAIEAAIGEAVDGAAEIEAALEQWLRALQRANGQRSFGVCASCRFFEREGSRTRCGLTQELLSVRDSERICREHEYPARAR